MYWQTLIYRKLYCLLNRKKAKRKRICYKRLGQYLNKLFWTVSQIRKVLLKPLFVDTGWMGKIGDIKKIPIKGHPRL